MQLCSNSIIPLFSPHVNILLSISTKKWLSQKIETATLCYALGTRIVIA